MGTIGIVLSMLAAVVLSGIVIRALPLAVPAPLVQIAMGAAIAALGYRPVQLNPEIFFLLFLPPLLFLDGWRIPKEGLLRDRGVILELALGLVVFTVLGMGLFIHWLIPALPLPVAFALAAIISPTDPVAVSAINERAPMSRRLMHVLEGESLLNDASGLVCFRFAVAAALTGAFSLSAAGLTFMQLALGGVIVGTVLTYAVMLVKNVISHRIGEEAGSQVLISLLIPFGAYELAEQLGCSGILAAVAAGITMSYVELSGHAMARTRVQRAAVWDTMQFTLNGVMFVLLGEQLPGILDGAVGAVRQSNHQSPWWLVVYAFAIWLGLTALRFTWVWVSIRRRRWIAAKHGEDGGAAPGWRLITAVSVAGVRGAITLAGVLTLPLALPDGTPFPGRELTIFLAAAVIILSLILASITLPRLLRGLTPLAESAGQVEIDQARAAAAKAAIQAIEQALYRMTRGRENVELYTEAAARVMDLYRRRIDGQTSIEDAARIRRSDDIERDLRLAGLNAERDTLFALARSNSLSDETSRRLVRDIDLLEERLR